ncbi:MAG: class I SAM-dependent methyltransferase [Pyrinomonadaceae bacterium]
MRKIFNVAKWGLSLGRESQNFLGAKWITAFLAKVPNSGKRSWALRILSLSPHYFLDPENPAYKAMSNDEYLEATFAEGVESREKIYTHILKDHLNGKDIVLDYGCGPGFLAKALAPHVSSVFACDISPGALACARILNAADNLEYVAADDAGLSLIRDESIDAVISFAMVQHITDDIFDQVLRNMHRKLRSGGKLILHIQLLDAVWRTEDEWKGDQSLTGRIKYRYGLHCFARSEVNHIRAVETNGFSKIKITSIADFVPEQFDDICSQSLLVAVKS